MLDTLEHQMYIYYNTLEYGQKSSAILNLSSGSVSIFPDNIGAIWVR